MFIFINHLFYNIRYLKKKKNFSLNIAEQNFFFKIFFIEFISSSSVSPSFTQNLISSRHTLVISKTTIKYVHFYPS